MARLDVYLAEKGLAASREKAKKLISAGMVTVGSKVVMKPSAEVSETDEINVARQPDYVGRGALKLVKALEVFGIEVNGRVCADIGASTGGFTQVLLRNGASEVWALDVGHGQLDPSLAADSRVRNIEGINVRYLPEDFFGKKADLACCDLSFISLTKILPALSAALPCPAEIVVLIKPQFEVGKQALGKNGVVKNKKKHIEVLDSLLLFFPTVGLYAWGLDHSPISGGDGNIEYLCYLKKTATKETPIRFDTRALVERAFSELK